MSERAEIAASRRWVVKVGSALLTDDGRGLDEAMITTLVAQLARLRDGGNEVVLVSSGAVAAGVVRLGMSSRPHLLHELQAAAAAGQSVLVQSYENAFKQHGLISAQVLLSHDDVTARDRYLNARGTLNTLLELGVIPVVNENDTVVTDEIRFGDNDRLGARVAAMVSADALILLSDIDGLYTADPSKEEAAEWIPEVHELTPEIEAMAGGSSSAVGSGGMITKLAAAKIAMGAGCRMVIARGHDEHPIKALRDGARSTWFIPSASPRAARKDWIAGSLKPRGALVIDDGAEAALGKGKSLLPAGVRSVAGSFQRGDLVQVENADGVELARGLSAYAAGDVELIKGRKTGEIEELLGYRGRDEVIHRDDMVITNRQTKTVG